MYPISTFEKHHPKSAAGFDMSPAGLYRWRLEVDDHNWTYSPIFVGLCEDLLFYCATWYNEHNAFTAPRFSARLWLLRKELDIMARKTSNSKLPKRADWKGFLDFRLTEDDLNDCDEWQPSPQEVWVMVDNLIQADLTITVLR